MMVVIVNQSNDDKYLDQWMKYHILMFNPFFVFLNDINIDPKYHNVVIKLLCDKNCLIEHQTKLIKIIKNILLNLEIINEDIIFINSNQFIFELSSDKIISKFKITNELYLISNFNQKIDNNENNFNVVEYVFDNCKTIINPILYDNFMRRITNDHKICKEIKEYDMPNIIINKSERPKLFLYYDDNHFDMLKEKYENWIFNKSDEFLTNLKTEKYVYIYCNYDVIENKDCYALFILFVYLSNMLHYAGILRMSFKSFNDIELIMKILNDVGFHDVCQCSINESSFQPFRDMEKLNNQRYCIEARV